MTHVDLNAIQMERTVWVRKNFPNRVFEHEVDESIMGCIEELGELAHSHLKAAQHIRGTDEEHAQNAYDSVGDALVYLLGICTCSDFTLTEAISRTRPLHYTTPERALFQASAKLGRIAVDGQSGFPRLIQRHVGEFYWALASYCTHRGWDVQECLLTTWAQVKNRNWIANPGDGSAAEAV